MKKNTNQNNEPDKLKVGGLFICLKIAEIIGTAFILRIFYLTGLIVERKASQPFDYGVVELTFIGATFIGLAVLTVILIALILSPWIMVNWNWATRILETPAQKKLIGKFEAKKKAKKDKELAKERQQEKIKLEKERKERESWTKYKVGDQVKIKVGLYGKYPSNSPDCDITVGCRNARYSEGKVLTIVKIDSDRDLKVNDRDNDEITLTDAMVEPVKRKPGRPRKVNK